ncbi:MAG: MFS transporter [Chloroflexi bacterium]|nr:MFS transporter [Chloroflexota bacterium]
MNIHERQGIASGEVKGARRFPARFLSSGFHSLKVRNFRLFIFGQIVSLTGTWMQTTAQAWLVLELSNSPLALGVVTTLQFLPVTILSLYGGVLADRLPKRRTLIATQSLLLIQAAIFGFLVGTNMIQLWHIYFLAISQGIVQAIDTPVRQAFISEMVGRDELVNAVALNSMTFNGARIIGPAVAGFVIAQFGIAPALYFNAASYVAVIFALFMMSEKALFKALIMPQGSAWKRLKEGLTFVWRTPELLVLIIALAAIGTFGYNFTVTLPLISDFILHSDAQGFGILSSVFGVGSLTAAIATAYIRNPTHKVILIAAAIFSLLFVLTAITPYFAITALILAGLGAAAIVFSTGVNSLMQLNTPDELRGRVMSINVLLILGSTPVGAFLIGLMSDHLGVPAAVMTCAMLCLLGVGIAALYLRRHRAVESLPQSTPIAHTP